MDTADVQGKLSIYKYPHIIIAGELIDNVFTAYCLAAFGDFKIDLHAHSDMMVQILVLVNP